MFSARCGAAGYSTVQYGRVRYAVIPPRRIDVRDGFGEIMNYMVFARVGLKSRLQSRLHAEVRYSVQFSLN